MEDLKEMFVQMMRFQMESQQKNEERLFQLLQGNKEKKQKKWGKTPSTSERKQKKTTSISTKKRRKTFSVVTWK